MSLRWLNSLYNALCQTTKCAIVAASLSACVPHELVNSHETIVLPDLEREAVTIQNDPLQLQDSVRLAILASNDVATAGLNVERKINDITIAKSSFYPELYATSTPGSGDGNLANIDLGVRYTLYDFGARVAALEGSVAAAQSSQFDLASRIDATAQNAVNLYITAAIQNTITESSRAYIARIAALKERVRARVDIGVASSVDLNEVETASISADTILLEALADQKTAEQELSSRLNFPVASVLSSDTIAQGLSVPREGLLTTPDVDTYPRIAALSADVREAESVVDATAAGLLPQIGWRLGAAIGLQSGESWKKTGISNGLEISQVLSLGGGRAEAIRNAEIGLADAQRRLQEERRLLTLELAQSNVVRSSSIEALAQREKILDLTIQTRDVMTTEYLVGSRSLRDLLNAEESIYQAQVRVHEAQRSALLGQLRFLMARNLATVILYEVPK